MSYNLDDLPPYKGVYRGKELTLEEFRAKPPQPRAVSTAKLVREMEAKLTAYLWIEDTLNFQRSLLENIKLENKMRREFKIPQLKKKQLQAKISAELRHLAIRMYPSFG